MLNKIAGFILMAFFMTALSGEAAVSSPVLKWKFGGCYSTWCEHAFYSSPAVADLDQDGYPEVIGAAYSVFVLDGRTGALKWRVPTGYDRTKPNAASVGRTWPKVIAMDIDQDGKIEIITGHQRGCVSVYTHDGYFKPGWPKYPAGDNEIRGLIVADLDHDGKLEIIVSASTTSKLNTWVFKHDGTLYSGWPQLNDTNSYARGVYNDGVAVGDINGDGRPDIVVPSDVHYICAYHANGAQLPTAAIFGGKNWGQVGIWETATIEYDPGWGTCNGVRAQSYRANFEYGVSVITDLNGDKIPEIAVTGNVYNCNAEYPPSKYIGLFIFNSDRTRFNTGGYDWRTTPIDTGAPLSESYSVMETIAPNLVVADIDGDGKKELLFPSYNGKMHVFWLDKTQRHNWPYSVYKPAENFYRFATEPVVVDLDNDGKAEVIFGSWPQKQTSGTLRLGKLHILNYQGNVLHEIALPGPLDYKAYNGAAGAPVLADIDGDGELELIINTNFSGLVVYDLPGASNARVLWGTARDGQVWYQPSFICDLNDDGRVGLADAILALRICAGVPITPPVTGNYNCESSKIGLPEAILIMREAANLP